MRVEQKTEKREAEKKGPGGGRDIWFALLNASRCIYADTCSSALVDDAVMTSHLKDYSLRHFCSIMWLCEGKKTREQLKVELLGKPVDRVDFKKGACNLTIERTNRFSSPTVFIQ